MPTAVRRESLGLDRGGEVGGGDFLSREGVAVVIAAAAVQDQGGDHRDQEREHVEA